MSGWIFYLALIDYMWTRIRINSALEQEFIFFFIILIFGSMSGSWKFRFTDVVAAAFIEQYVLGTVHCACSATWGKCSPWAHVGQHPAFINVWFKWCSAGFLMDAGMPARCNGFLQILMQGQWTYVKAYLTESLLGGIYPPVFKGKTTLTTALNHCWLLSSVISYSRWPPIVSCWFHPIVTSLMHLRIPIFVCAFWGPESVQILAYLETRTFDVHACFTKYFIDALTPITMEFQKGIINMNHCEEMGKIRMMQLQDWRNPYLYLRTG